MKVEMIKDMRHQGELFAEGEVRVVTEGTGTYFCKAGVAKDVDGIVPTEEPKSTDVVMFVDNSTINVTENI